MEVDKRYVPEQVCNYLSLLQLKYDCETICSLMTTLQHNGITAFGLIPYISLTTASALELLPPDTASLFQESDFLKVKDVRLKLKIFEDGYHKSKKMLLNIDYLQDQVFKDLLKHDYMKTWNMHHNLGIYTDQNKRVVGNTQFNYYLLQDNRLLKKNLTEVAKAYSASPDRFSLDEQIAQEAYQYAYKCGQVIGAVCSSLEYLDVPISIATQNNHVQYYFTDYNTNIKSALFPSDSQEKAIRLYLLHILSTINFLLYILNPSEKDDYGWWLKINYISYHYAIHKLNDLQHYLIQNKLLTQDVANYFDEMNIQNAPYINKKLRNYVMHSKFVDKEGISIIGPDHLDKSKPLFGLIESCYDSINYVKLKSSIISETTKISDVLSRWLNTSSLQVTPL